MALFGNCMETWKPYHGCTTFKTDLILGRIPGHMAACLADLVRSTTLKDIVNIEISSRAMKGGYLANTGEYVGSGMKVFTLDLETDTEWLSFTVRAQDRQKLRKALKLLYPTAKVSR